MEYAEKSLMKTVVPEVLPFSTTFVCTLFVVVVVVVVVYRWLMISALPESSLMFSI